MRIDSRRIWIRSMLVAAFLLWLIPIHALADGDGEKDTHVSKSTISPSDPRSGFSERELQLLERLERLERRVAELEGRDQPVSHSHALPGASEAITVASSSGFVPAATPREG